MKKVLLVLVLSALFLSTHANDFEERLRRNLQTRADGIFRKFTSSTPGCSAGAFYNHKIIFEKGYGLKRLNPNQPFAPETITRIASVSKQFCAMCIAILIEDGKLTEEDDIRRWLPRLPRTWGHVVRVKHLIYMISGLFEYDDFIDHTKVNDKEVIWRVIDQRGGRLRFVPGQKEEYCNTNYFLLGEIVEAVSGLTLRKFADQEIFSKLGMKSTYFEDGTQTRIPDIARGYENKNGRWIEVKNTYMTVGDSGLKINVRDWLPYDTAYYFPDKIRHGRKVMQRIVKTGVLNSGAKITYGYGIDVLVKNRVRVHEHDGSYYGYTAQYARYPDDKFSVVCMCNDANSNPWDYCDGIRRIYDETKVQPMWEMAYYSGLFAVLSFVGVVAYRYIRH